LVKSLQELLRELARPGVTEFAMASDRLPCVKIGDKYEPVDQQARGKDAVIEMLSDVGGRGHLEHLETKPATWTTRIDGVGTVSIQAVLQGGRVRVRITLAQAPARVPAPEPARAPTPARAPAPAPAPELASFIEPTRIAAAAPPAAQPSSPSSLDAILRSARGEGASDVHVVADRPVAVRLAGELVIRGQAIAAANVESMLADIVPERLEPVLLDQGSCDFAMQRAGLGRFRVNVSRQRTGLKGCFRCIPDEPPTLASLGLPPEIERATHHHQGLVLVTGPTGHGKTTTLAAIVDIINASTTHHVITVEDPVEFLHPRKRAMMSQREVGSNTRSFAAALKGSLREDPDVIVVGELRDTETVRMALAASETGHLVLGTMNTPSAAKTIDRLVDLFPPGDQQQVRMTLAGGLHLVVSQRLVPTADGKKMAAAVELLPGSVPLWSLIRDNKTFQIPSLQQRGKAFGIIRIDESLADLVRSGRISREAALKVAEAPEKFDAKGGA
jgi:twitching motility protein PilT